MVASVTATISIRLRWWLRWYLYGVVIAHCITGCRPSEEHLAWWIERGLYFKTDAS